MRWAEGSVATSTETSSRQADLPAVRWETCELSWSDLNDGQDTYWACRTSKLRNKCDTAKKQLVSDGRLDSIHSRRPAADPRWDLFDRCKQVAAHSWQAAATSGNRFPRNANYCRCGNAFK